jgi:phosphoribosylamine--glycine ligase
LKVLLVDHDAVGLAFALRCQKAGHQVRWFIKDKPSNNLQTGDGFKGIEKVKNWVAHMKWADLVWMSSNDDYLPRMDFFKKQGANVFGPSAASARLEIERGAGMKFFEDHGIEVPEYKTFKTLKEAEMHVRKTEERYVFKTLGSNEDKSLSYCSKSPADMIARLQRWQKINMNPQGPVMLQKFIPGHEFAVSRWMGSNGFIGMYNENFEHKKLLSGNCGPNCGESGTVQKYVEDSTLGEVVLAPLEESLLKLGHLGDVDVNCIIDEKGKAWPLEFTMRCGWPAFNIMMAEHRGDPVEWMRDACEGEDTMDCSTAIAAGVVIGQPDYPYSNLTKKDTVDIPFYGVTDKNRRFIAPQGIKMDKMPDMDGDKVVEKDMWVTCSDYLAVVTGTGSSVRQACDRAYAVIDDLHVPDMIYRDDIGEKLEEEIEKLQELGYAAEFIYE